MSTLHVQDLGMTYGSGTDAFIAIDEISLTAQPGELLCIVGPSGCGKTTMLRCVSGLMRPTRGTVHLDQQLITGPPRSMALVFQDYSRSLLPWMTVHRNVVLPLKARGVPRSERNELAREALASVGLEGHGHKYPWQLSGGMQQRTAIARALAYQAEILLLDEPFASVDAQTRADLEDLLLEVWKNTDMASASSTGSRPGEGDMARAPSTTGQAGTAGLTVLHVTHDIDEAVYLADRIVVLSASPTRVKETVRVELPRPRDQIATKELPEFAHLRAHIFASIKAESAQRRPSGNSTTVSPTTTATTATGEDHETTDKASTMGEAP